MADSLVGCLGPCLVALALGSEPNSPPPPAAACFRERWAKAGESELRERRGDGRGGEPAIGI